MDIQVEWVSGAQLNGFRDVLGMYAPRIEMEEREALTEIQGALCGRIIVDDRDQVWAGRENWIACVRFPAKAPAEVPVLRVPFEALVEWEDEGHSVIELYDMQRPVRIEREALPASVKGFAPSEEMPSRPEYETKAEHIRALLRADYLRSNRSIAQEVGVSPPHVWKVRERMEQTEGLPERPPSPFNPNKGKGESPETPMYEILYTGLKVISVAGNLRQWRHALRDAVEQDALTAMEVLELRDALEFKVQELEQAYLAQLRLGCHVNVKPRPAVSLPANASREYLAGALLPPEQRNNTASWTPFSLIYEDYCLWCQAQGLAPLSKNAFGRDAKRFLQENYAPLGRRKTVFEEQVKKKLNRDGTQCVCYALRVPPSA